MINSMTGFGHADIEIDGISYSVEIRSVNNRYLKTHLRLPDMAAFLGEDIESVLRNSIKRGTVNYSLHIKNISGQALFDINQNVIQGYLQKLNPLAENCNVKCTIDLAQLLTLPGTVTPLSPDADLEEKIKKTVLELTGVAIEKLKQMRTREGEALAKDLIENCGSMQQIIEMIGQKSPCVVAEYHKKLHKRIDELIANAKIQIDQDMLAKEVAIFADRSDIAEELARLQSHIQQFVQFCKNGTNGGRKLDFIAQEMLREANTIASKASDTQICQWVIDIKCAIDRIKEQVQNVE